MGEPKGERQERSRQRRELLLRSALDLLGNGGGKAVTHRAVSTHAGLPPASAGYYFESIQELLEQALRFHVAERIHALGALLDAALRGAATIDEVASRVARALISGESGIGVAQYEVYLEAARNPKLRPVVAEAIAAFEQMAGEVLAHLGARDPDDAAVAFVGMLDGFAMHRLAAPRPEADDLATMERAIRGLFLMYAIDVEEVQRLRARFQRPPSGGEG